MLSARLETGDPGPGPLDGAVRAAKERLKRAGVLLQTECRKTLSVPNPPPFLHSSKPGQPPKLRTAWLRNHVFLKFAPDGLSCTVGVGRAAAYGVYLELKGSRPWLYATYERLKKRLLEIILG